MTDFLESLGGWAGGITILVGAIVGVVVQKTWDNHLGRAIPVWRKNIRSRVDSARGRTLEVGLAKPTVGDVLPQYFRRQEPQVDLVIYELSLRPNVPVMDLLYFEYLRSRLANGSIKEAVIVPWSGWRDDTHAEAERKVQRNIESIFGRHAQRVTVVTAEMLQQHAGSVFENHFFEMVGNLGNSDFLRNASAVMGYRFQSYHDINQGHPETHQARSIVEHTVRGWLIAKYVEAEHLANSGDSRRVASIMWERELTKLLLLRNLLESHPDLECSLILGASVSYRRRLRSHPVPTFVDSAITIFGDLDDQITRIRRKSHAELRRTNRVLTDILSTRSGLGDMTGWGANIENRPDLHLSGDGMATLRSILRFRSLYGFSE
ncbi:hypothetical protein M8542_30675 [Amycolatopsis sp. OK19-0408]|uniref:Uncharacterized protein n=1 Tax=Amycolatopsis iheyensis TaxID=2945988 RepID=A0A9X2NH70_9PSEU|nr:hypothetical protein [Amycolatopsis iheyensis]MCR6487203.1 hypothetical protein [Amycolatopsis iheyensis]